MPEHTVRSTSSFFTTAVVSALSIVVAGASSEPALTFGKPTCVLYTKSGDTIQSIAAQSGYSLESLSKANPMLSEGPLQQGLGIVLPNCTPSMASSVSDATARAYLRRSGPAVQAASGPSPGVATSGKLQVPAGFGSLDAVLRDLEYRLSSANPSLSSAGSTVQAPVSSHPLVPAASAPMVETRPGVGSAGAALPNVMDGVASVARTGSSAAGRASARAADVASVAKLGSAKVGSVASFRAAEEADDDERAEAGAAPSPRSSRRHTPAALRREARRAFRAAGAVPDPRNPLGEDDNEPDVPALSRGTRQSSHSASGGLAALEGVLGGSGGGPNLLRNPIQAAQNLLPNMHINTDALEGEGESLLPQLPGALFASGIRFPRPAGRVDPLPEIFDFFRPNFDGLPTPLLDLPQP